MRKLLCILSLLCISIASYSQTAASYGFSSLSAPFVSIAGTGTAVPSLTDDDFTEIGIPIGFTFNYCGASYTDLSACTNGWVSLTNSPSITFNNIETDIDGAGWLMPFWDDNEGIFSSFGTAFHETTGVAPFRVFTFEWNTYSSISGFGDITFQVKLYESTNVIDFHYGLSSMIFTDATIGISNDNISDWQTLSDESAAAIPLPSPIFNTLIFGAPADGQIFRWTPSCTLPAPIVGTLTTCTGATITLTHDTTGGVWSSSDPVVATIVATTGVVTGISAGTSEITYTAASGCFATAIVTVTAPTPITGTMSVCEGSTTTLANATPGGTWSSGSPLIADVDPTGLVVGLIAGTAVISYTLPSGCVATTVVTVNTAPGGISGTFAICLGGSTTLTNSVTGGTWSSGFPGVASIGVFSGVVSGVSSGTTLITYTMPGGCFRLAAFTVNPLPAPITGGSSICVAGTLGLSSTTFGGTWSSSTPAVATVAGTGSGTADVTGVSGGTTTITYTLATGCFATTVVTVTTVVAPITGPAAVCRLSFAGYTNATPGGTWSSSTPAVGTINTITGLLYANSAGTTTISYTVGSGCFATTIVTVNPLEPITGINNICVGGSTTLSNTVPGGTWSSSTPAIAIVDAATGVVTGVAAGVVAIQYLNPSGCNAIIAFTVNPLPAAISGDLHICVGNTSALASAPAGGAWSHTPLGAVSINAVTGVMTGLSVGTSEVTYTLPTTGCSISATATVDAAPAAITGITVLCPNTTAILSQATPGGTWSSSNVGVATVGASTGVVTGVNLTGGTATITYTLPTSGCIATTVVTVLAAPLPITGNLSVCLGATSTLSTLSAGATWSSGNVAVATIGAATGIVTGVSLGTSTIICHGTNGCTRSVIVTVNPNPAALTGTAVVCVGATTTLSSTTGGGAWTSSAGGIASVAGGVVTGVSANTATISYTLPTGCFATRVVTVNPIPGVITGPGSVCVGQTITQGSSAGGTWSSSNTTVATVDAATGIVTGLVAGTANISYTIANGCFRVRAVTVNPLPAAITGPTNVCPGSTITLTSATPLGAWSSSNTAVATVGTGTGIVAGLSGGTTTITYTLGTGCITTTVVTVIAAPIAAITPIGDTVLCPGDFVTLTSSASVGATYIWYNGGVPISGATTPTYIASITGSYQVRVSVAVGCTTLSAPVSVAVVPAIATITLPGGSATTCAGTPVALNANTGTGLTYQWELAGTAIAGATTSVFNATASGSYTVRVINSAGCWAVSAPEVITVNPAPLNVVTASGPITFCDGGNVTLTASTGTGYTYQWFNTAGAITGATSAAFTATTAESYFAEVTNTFGCTTTTLTTIVNVNPLPDVTVTTGGPLLFCAGGSVLLTSVPGFAYQWYRGSVAIPGANSLGYVANMSGGYRVRVTDLLTGCTDMTHADTVVTVVAAPTVLTLTPAKFCWGGSSLLSTSASTLGSAITYQWFFNSAAIVGATSPTYSATAAGLYSCQISVPSSCTIATSTVSVNEMPLPNPPITISGASMRTANMYVSYQWYKNLTPIAGATAYSTPITGNGNYKVAVTDTNGCQSVSAVYVLTDWKGGGATGVAEVSNTAISIFPNPANKSVHITGMPHMRAVIAGVDGRALIDQKDATDINISSLADGMYIITVYDSENQLLKTQKLIKVSE
ncbi:MAG: Ig-like domain-containing protein [Taibaiella sp.]|nr:Ig-like domain-containing protein [Taibaiella sp.]